MFRHLGSNFPCQNCRSCSSCKKAVHQGPGIKSVCTSVTVEEREQHACLFWFWTGSQPACPWTHVAWEQLVLQGELEPGGHQDGETLNRPLLPHRALVLSSLPTLKASYGRWAGTYCGPIHPWIQRLSHHGSKASLAPCLGWWILDRTPQRSLRWKGVTAFVTAILSLVGTTLIHLMLWGCVLVISAQHNSVRPTDKARGNR